MPRAVWQELVDVNPTGVFLAEWADRDIRVNTVSPGYTATPMALHPDVWPQVQGYLEDIPLQRMADTAELVRPVVFLLAPPGSYWTGVDLLVDGGATLW